MAKNKKNFFARLVEGSEKSEDYARRTLPSSRWSLGWDIIKTSLGKLCKINLLMLLFIFPILVLYIFRDTIISSLGMNMPFSQNIGVGYPAFPYLAGMAQQITLNADMLIFLGILICTPYISVGISGGFYVIRNLVWAEGVFVFSDFFKGVKKNYLSVLVSTFVYVIILACSFLSIDLVNIMVASAGNNFFAVFSKILSCIFIGFFSIVYLYSLTLTVTYKLSFFKLIRNAFIFTIGILPINLFFVALSLVPFILLLFSPTSFFFTLGIILLLLLSIALFVLIFTNFSHWTFDEFLNDKIAGAKKNRGIYKKNQEESQLEESTILSNRRIVKPITDTDIEIEVLPESYSRADLIKLEESKKRMIEDSQKYVEEHQAEYDKTKSEIDELMKEDSSKTKKKNK